MSAFFFILAVAALALWVCLSIEHGMAVGKSIKKIIKKFFKGEKENHEQ